jgi:hypothetical protein
VSGATFGALSVHLGADVRIGCHAYPDQGPILFIDGVGVSLTVCPHTRKGVTAGDVTNARTLVEAVGVYLAECERIYSATDPGAEVSADGAAAAA